MKKILIIGFVIILLTVSGYAQNVYSRQNLEKAAREDLNLYLKRAKNKKTTGIVLTLVGPVTYTALYAVGHSDNSNLSLETVGTLFLIGAISTLVGIPTLITGSTRVKRINNILSNKAAINISLHLFQNNLAGNQPVGATLQIKF